MAPLLDIRDLRTEIRLRRSTDPAREHQGVRGELPSAVAPPTGCRFRTRCPLAQDICAVKEPPLRPFTATGHRAASHFPLRQPEPGLDSVTTEQTAA